VDEIDNRGYVTHHSKTLTTYRTVRHLPTLYACGTSPDTTLPLLMLGMCGSAATAPSRYAQARGIL
jgi:hypothetical protein